MTNQVRSTDNLVRWAGSDSPGWMLAWPEQRSSGSRKRPCCA